MDNSNSTFTVNREKQEVMMTRVFDAPRELVFKVYTDPAKVPEWWGPREYTTTVEKMDLKVDGSWRFIQRDKDGQEYAFSGKYLEIVKPEKLVFTFEYEPMPGHVLTETVLFEDVNGKTKMTDTSHYATLEDLDGMVASGMEWGARQTVERLAELVEKQ